MKTRRATLVLSGGGSRGAFQVGAEQVLRQEGGFDWERVYGVSVGALNGALIAQGEYQRLVEVWRTIRRQDVYRKVWWPFVVLRLLLGKTGFYDHGVLRRTIENHVGDRPFKIPLHVGRVSLTSGAYEIVPDPDEPGAVPRPAMLDAIWHSATMPVVWEPIGERGLVDGGLRTVTPLGDALRLDPTELVVLNCGPDHPEVFDKPPANVLEAARRSLADITINEIMVNDVREFERVNKLVRQAKQKDVTLWNEEKNRPYVECTMHVLRPAVHLGDSLNFEPAELQRRIEYGKATARQFLAGRVPEPGSSVASQIAAARP